MQKVFLAALLATGAVAIPRGNLPRSEAGTTTTSEATSTSDANAVVSPTDLKYQLKETCENGGRTVENWKKFDMDQYTGQIWEQFPKDIWFNHDDVSDDSSYVEYLTHIVGLSTTCTANTDDCDLIDSDSVDKCKGEGSGLAFDYWTPAVYFILDALQNCHSWQSIMYDNVLQLGTLMTSRSAEFVTDFTHHDVSGDGSSDDAAQMSAAMGILGAILFACEPCSAAIGAGSSTISMGAGLAAAAEEAATDMRVPFIVHFTEFANMGSLEKSLFSAVTAISDTFRSLGESVLEAKVTSVGKDFQNHPNSAPSVLQNGAFAEPWSSDTWDKTTENVNKYLAASAINSVWGTEEVFIVKGKSKKVNDQSFKSFRFYGELLVDDARVCEEGDDPTCYIFMIAQSIHNIQGSAHWYNPIGLDKLGNYDLDLLKFAQSAEWFQNTYGAYLQNATATDIFDALSSDDIGSTYFVNMPVVSWDEAPSIDPYDFYGNLFTEESYFLNILAHCVNTLHGWMALQPHVVMAFCSRKSITTAY